MAANQVDTTKVMKCNFVALPMNSGYAYNDYLTGTVVTPPLPKRCEAKKRASWCSSGKSTFPT
jgi:hypothetical protein